MTQESAQATQPLATAPLTFGVRTPAGLVTVTLQRTAQTFLVTVEQGAWRPAVLHRAFGFEADARVFARRIAVDLLAGFTLAQVVARFRYMLAA
jgi:hypothetical protein